MSAGFEAQAPEDPRRLYDELLLAQQAVLHYYPQLAAARGVLTQILYRSARYDRWVYDALSGQIKRGYMTDDGYEETVIGPDEARRTTHSYLEIVADQLGKAENL